MGRVLSFGYHFKTIFHYLDLLIPKSIEHSEGGGEGGGGGSVFMYEFHGNKWITYIVLVVIYGQVTNTSLSWPTHPKSIEYIIDSLEAMYEASRSYMEYMYNVH